jgi:hypothetical protein
MGSMSFSFTYGVNVVGRVGCALGAWRSHVLIWTAGSLSSEDSISTMEWGQREVKPTK